MTTTRDAMRIAEAYARNDMGWPQAKALEAIQGESGWDWMVLIDAGDDAGGQFALVVAENLTTSGADVCEETCAEDYHRNKECRR